MSSPSPTYERAIELLSRRTLSRSDLKARLLQTGSPTEIEEALDLLESRGYLNDSEFARQRATSHRQRKHWGNRRIDFDLRRHGIDGATRRQVLAELDSEADETTALERVIQSWIGREGKPRTDGDMRRLQHHCLRLGYARPDIVRRTAPLLK